jgi:hypothetical protein
MSMKQIDSYLHWCSISYERRKEMQCEAKPVAKQFCT